VPGQPFHFTCRRCAKLYHELLTASLAGIPENSSAPQSLEAIQSVIAECDKRVREAVQS
jgi:hypothetical protein